jgi:DNA-binding transcriptional ArsR family regulator
MSPGADADLDAVFAALADPTRRAVLTALLDGPRTVGEIAVPLPLSLAAVSKNLQILMRAGLVSQERSGRERTCRLEPDGLRVAGIWMQGMGGFEPEDYDALERLIEGVLEGSDDLEPPLTPY